MAVGSEKHSLSVPGIDFIFIQEESYDMVIRKEDFTKKSYQKMIEIIRSPEYQKEVAGLGSYNVENMGKLFILTVVADPNFYSQMSHSTTIL